MVIENEMQAAHESTPSRATSRNQGSVYERPPLSRKHMPSARSLRRDVPEWSVRVCPSFYTKA